MLVVVVVVIYDIVHLIKEANIDCFLLQVRPFIYQ